MKTKIIQQKSLTEFKDLYVGSFFKFNESYHIKLCDEDYIRHYINGDKNFNSFDIEQSRPIHFDQDTVVEFIESITFKD